MKRTTIQNCYQKSDPLFRTELRNVGIASLLAAILLAACAGPSPSAPTAVELPASPVAVPIARSGKAALGITISPQASEALRQTAAELTNYLQRITGATFVIGEGTEPAGITLGTLAQFPDDSLREPLAIRETYDGIEALAIRSDGGRIRLLGNTDLGAQHAAYRFLGLLGCRWFFQGATWEVVPHSPDLSFNLNEVSRPDIWSRNIWFGRTKQSWEPGDPDANAAFARWERGNRMGMSLEFNASHAWHAIPKAFKDEGFPYQKEFAAHPEYYALVDGQRVPPQFCVSNQGLQQLIVRYVTRYFEKNPAAHMVSLDTADQGGWCTCADCAKLGHYSAQPFYLANIAARALQKAHPGKYVGVLAYSWHSDPPPFDLEPNVYIQLTAGMNASKFSFDELFALWSKKCQHIGIYEYYSYWEMDHCMLPATGRQNNYESLGPRVRNFVSNHVDSISAQAANCWGVNGLGYYLAAQLMWDAKADTVALRRDFYQQAFGPAAPAMERYYERLNLANKPLKGAALLRQCLDDLEAATRLAEGRPDVQARLTHLKENLVFSHLGLQVQTAVGIEEEKKRTLEWFTWAYRTRNNYMNDWITFRSTVGRPAAEKLGMTNWFWRNTSDNPWRVDKPVTASELVTRLREMKTALGDLPPAPAREFSRRFVLVKTDRKGGDAVKQLFSGTATYLVASTNGEPLRLVVTKRETGWIEKPDADYSLATQDGHSLTNGGLATGRHDLTLAVPGPGIYRFTCSRGYTGWEIELPEALPNALVFERGEKCVPSHIQSAWLYVPKGTKEIVMYTAYPSSSAVHAPDGRVAYKGISDGRFVSIRVRDGEDGQPWSISGRPANLWFFNVPTALSSSPEYLYVPADVAKLDGLTIVATAGRSDSNRD